MIFSKLMYLGGETINDNGITFSSDAVRQIADKINQPTEMPVIYNNNLVGFVVDAKLTKHGVICTIDIYQNMILIMKDHFISPAGLMPAGIKLHADLVIDDFDLKEIQITKSPAFYHVLNFDDIDFESIIKYIKISDNVREGVLHWSASKGYQLNKKQMSQISEITEELTNARQ